MALNALTLSTSQGARRRPFQATINGLSSSNVRILSESTPAFYIVNGKLRSDRLPEGPVATVVLREFEPGVGAGYRDTTLDITIATRDALIAQATGLVGVGRTLRSWFDDATALSNGEFYYRVVAIDDQMAQVAAAIGGGTPPPTPTPTSLVTRTHESRTYGSSTMDGQAAAATLDGYGTAVPAQYIGTTLQTRMLANTLPATNAENPAVAVTNRGSSGNSTSQIQTTIATDISGGLIPNTNTIAQFGGNFRGTGNAGETELNLHLASAQAASDFSGASNFSHVNTLTFQSTTIAMKYLWFAKCRQEQWALNQPVANATFDWLPNEMIYWKGDGAGAGFARTAQDIVLQTAWYMPNTLKQNADVHQNGHGLWVNGNGSPSLSIISCNSTNTPIWFSDLPYRGLVTGPAQYVCDLKPNRSLGSLTTANFTCLDYATGNPLIDEPTGTNFEVRVVGGVAKIYTTGASPSRINVRVRITCIVPGYAPLISHIRVSVGVATPASPTTPKIVRHRNMAGYVSKVPLLPRDVDSVSLCIIMRRLPDTGDNPNCPAGDGTSRVQYLMTGSGLEANGLHDIFWSGAGVNSSFNWRCNLPNSATRSFSFTASGRQPGDGLFGCFYEVDSLAGTGLGRISGGVRDNGTTYGVSNVSPGTINAGQSRIGPLVGTNPDDAFYTWLLGQVPFGSSDTNYFEGDIAFFALWAGVAGWSNQTQREKVLYTGTSLADPSRVVYSGDGSLTNFGGSTMTPLFFWMGDAMSRTFGAPTAPDATNFTSGKVDVTGVPGLLPFYSPQGIYENIS